MANKRARVVWFCRTGRCVPHVLAGQPLGKRSLAPGRSARSCWVGLRGSKTYSSDPPNNKTSKHNKDAAGHNKGEAPYNDMPDTGQPVLA